jgi:hypothetical protein
MRSFALAAALVLAGVALAGCTLDTQQSTAPTPSAGDERTFAVDVPSGATQLRVDTTATAQSGDPDVTVLVKDDSGNILGSHTWALKDRATDSLTVSVTGQSHVTVAARAVDGDASLDVRVTALVPNQPEVVVVQQTIAVSPTPAVTTPTPAPTVSTPTPTPAPSPTPASPTNATTNTSNATANATTP